MGDTAMRIYEFGPFRVDTVRRVLIREGNDLRIAYLYRPRGFFFGFPGNLVRLL